MLVETPAQWRGFCPNLVMQGKFASRFQPRVSNDSPKLNAFCRVALSVRFKVRAMLAARTFFFA